MENLTQVDGLEINQVEDGFIIYHAVRDRVHFLNHTAVFVLELCNGRHEPKEIIEIVRASYSLTEPPEEEVWEVLEKLAGEGLIRSR